MPYIHYAMRFGPGMLEEYERLVEVMDSIESPYLTKYGAKLIGRWKVSIGQMNQVISLYYYRDIADRAKVVAELRRDKKWAENAPGIYGTIGASTVSLLEQLGPSPIAGKIDTL